MAKREREDLSQNNHKKNRNNEDDIIEIDNSLEMISGKHSSKGKWIKESSRIEMMTIKGNYWRVTGYTEKGKNYLYPEEALFLVEKNQLVVVDEEDIVFRKDVFYELVIAEVSLPCYLSYSKLKMMDYIVTRYSPYVRTITMELLNDFPEGHALEFFVSFTVYGNTSSWSKKGCATLPPNGLVIVTDAESTFPPLMTLSLLSQTPSPLLFSIVTPTGHIYLEEFTDALLALDWTLPCGIPTGSSIHYPNNVLTDSENIHENSHKLDDERSSDASKIS